MMGKDEVVLFVTENTPEQINCVPGEIIRRFHTKPEQSATSQSKRLHGGRPNHLWTSLSDLLRAIKHHQDENKALRNRLSYAA